MNHVVRYATILILVLTVSCNSGSNSTTQTGTNTQNSSVNQDQTIQSNLESTRWKFEFQSESNQYSTQDFIFGPGGVLRNLNKADRTPMNDFWSIKDGQVVLSVNDGKAVYTSAPIKPNTNFMTGTMTNFRKQKWTWRATKRKEVLIMTK